MKIEKRYLNAALEVANFKKGKEILQCVHFTKDGRLQATDSYILIDINLNITFERDFSIKLDKDLIDLLSSENARLTFTDDKLTIETPNKAVSININDSPYPDFDYIFKTVSTGELSEISLSDIVLSKVVKVMKALNAFSISLEMPRGSMNSFEITFNGLDNIRFIATPVRKNND